LPLKVTLRGNAHLGHVTEDQTTPSPETDTWGRKSGLLVIETGASGCLGLPEIIAWLERTDKEILVQHLRLIGFYHECREGKLIS